MIDTKVSIHPKRKTAPREASKVKTLAIFIATIVLGFVLFVLPNLFFGITKMNGGLIGVNLLGIALFQLVAVCSLLYCSLRLLGKNFRYIGLRWRNWKKDCVLGLLTGLVL